MVRFLSTDWIAELDRAASTNPALHDATADIGLTVQQVVTGSPDDANSGTSTSTGAGSDTEETTWHVVVDHGTVRVRPGRADHADVSFTQDRATATAVGRGELSAQAAFMLGKLRVGGDVSLLMLHQTAFAGLDDVFADVRARTAY